MKSDTIVVFIVFDPVSDPIYLLYSIHLGLWFALLREEREVRLRFLESPGKRWAFPQAAQVRRRVLVRVSEGQHQVCVEQRSRPC